jgi:hypothetical protein
LKNHIEYEFGGIWGKENTTGGLEGTPYRNGPPCKMIGRPKKEMVYFVFIEPCGHTYFYQIYTNSCLSDI